MSTYTCSSCSEPIPASKARLQCKACPAYQSCANCFVVSQVSGTHTMEHATTLFKSSGLLSGTSPPPVNEATRPIVAATTTPIPVTNEGESDEPPPAYQASESPPAQAPPFPPPNQRPPPPSTQTRPIGQPLPPQSLQPAVSSPGPPPPTSNWSFLFNQNATPTPLFVTLMQEVFSHLDPSRTGYLQPETYASYLDVQGCKPEDNIWRNAYTNAYGDNREAVADAALRAAYDTFSIEYHLQPRRGQDPSSMGRLTSSFGNLMSGPFQPSSDMPLLTLRGFIDLVTTEVLMDPSEGWSDLNHMIRYYQLPIWRAMGDIPRHVIPDVPNPIMVQRVNAITQHSVAMATQAANIQAQGNLAAVNAIGGTQWEYRHY